MARPKGVLFVNSYMFDDGPKLQETWFPIGRWGGIEQPSLSHQ